MNLAISPTATSRPARETTSKLQTLIRTLQLSRYFTSAQVKETLLQINISSEELMPWADFDHPVADSYGRKLVYNGGHFEIMVMSWVPGDFSAIHDHGFTQWGAVQCFGAAEHYIYQFAKGTLRTVEAAHYTPGMIRSVDHNLIHQMGNAGSEPFLSLHVYGCGHPRTAITGNARIFDLLEGSVQYTDGGVFFCLPEAQIIRRTYGVTGNRKTTLRHHHQMGDRLRRILEDQNDPALADKLSLLTHHQSKL